MKGVAIMAKVYGYCRCSTNDTKQDIDRQVRELKEMGAQAATIYKEYVSGMKHRSAPNKQRRILSGPPYFVFLKLSLLNRLDRPEITVENASVKVLAGNTLPVGNPGIKHSPVSG